jgi:hypothetical protein
MNDQEQYERLVDAMVYPDLSVAYRSNAEFKAAIDLIARTAPRFLAAMAEEAQQRAKYVESITEAMMRGIPIRVEELDEGEQR